MVKICGNVRKGKKFPILHVVCTVVGTHKSVGSCITLNYEAALCLITVGSLAKGCRCHQQLRPDAK